MSKRESSARSGAGLAAASGFCFLGGPGLSTRDSGAGLAASNSWFFCGPVLGARG